MRLDLRLWQEKVIHTQIFAESECFVSTNIDDEKKRLSKWLDETREKTAAALKGIDPNLMIYADAGWRVKDIIAHLTAWEVEVTTSVRAYASGRSYSIFNYEDDDTYNKQAYLNSRDMPAGQIFGDWAAIRAGLKTAIRAIPPARFGGEIMCPWHETSTIEHIVKDMVNHEDEHLQDILKAAGG
jgi:hypothetical protein